MEIRFLNDFTNNNLHNFWNEILSQSNDANIQLTYEWLSIWWEVFGNDKKLSLITVTDGDKIIGIAPLIITRIIGKAGLVLRKLTFIGYGITDYHNLIIANEKREEALRILIDFIIDHKKNWDVVHFNNIRGDSPNLPILRNILEDTSLTVTERINIQSPYISIDRDWTSYFNALSKNVRSDIRRRLNYLSRMEKAELIHLHKVEDITGTLDIIKSIHVKCRQAKGETSLYADENKFKFVSMIMKQFSDRKWLDIVFLKLNDRIIAYSLGFVYDNTVSYWNAGFDPEFSKLSPGKMLLYHWIRDSFEAGYREFDFMIGEEPYKFQWTSRVRPNYEFLLFNNTMRSNLLKCYYKNKLLLKKNPYIQKIGSRIMNRVKV